jgi:nitrate/nitrite transport system ATP-binding protein
MHKRPRELSLGMQQRVGLARAFAIAPKLLLLDEPFGMLDSLTRMELQEVLAELLRKDGKTALMVTHDVDEALFLADRIVMMTNGPRAAVGEIITAPFERPRRRAEVLAHPEYYERRERMLRFLEEWERKKPSSAA